MYVSIVVPTYNERDNIQELFSRLDAAFGDNDHDVEVVVVDDQSPDGTADLARSVGKRVDLDVRVIVRTADPDLSRSVVRGFREATGDIIVVMDADLQHPPEVVPELASKVAPHRPIVVGTRYAEGGRIEEWPLFRRIVSYGALILAKILIPPARGVSDPISGFFAVQADSLNPDALSPAGYKILLELLLTIHPEEVTEVGFLFASRAHGKTSLSSEQYVRFVRHLLLAGLRYRFGQT